MKKKARECFARHLKVGAPNEPSSYMYIFRAPRTTFLNHKPPLLLPPSNLTTLSYGLIPPPPPRTNLSTSPRQHSIRSRRRHPCQAHTDPEKWGKWTGVLRCVDYDYESDEDDG